MCVRILTLPVVFLILVVFQRLGLKPKEVIYSWCFQWALDCLFHFLMPTKCASFLVKLYLSEDLHYD